MSLKPVASASAIGPETWVSCAGDGLLPASNHQTLRPFLFGLLGEIVPRPPERPRVPIAGLAPCELKRPPIEVSPLQAATAQVVIRQLRQLRVDASCHSAPAPGRQHNAYTGPEKPRHAFHLIGPRAPKEWPLNRPLSAVWHAAPWMSACWTAERPRRGTEAFARNRYALDRRAVHGSSLVCHHFFPSILLVSSRCTMSMRS
jgi:hypothetical protein